MHDVREALEALGAEGAARHRTEADLAELVAATEAVEAAVNNIAHYLDANFAWHLAIMRASHNERLVSFMNLLANATRDVTENEVFATAHVREATLKIHRSILQAILDGDADAARRRMARHVGAAREVALSGRIRRAAVAGTATRIGPQSATAMDTKARGQKRRTAGQSRKLPTRRAKKPRG